MRFCYTCFDLSVTQFCVTYELLARSDNIHILLTLNHSDDQLYGYV